MDGLPDDWWDDDDRLLLGVCMACGASYLVDFEPALHCHSDEAWEPRFVPRDRPYYVVQRVEHVPDEEEGGDLSSLGHVPDASMLVEGGLIEPRSHSCGREMGVGSLTLSADRMRAWFHCAVCNETEAILDTIHNPLAVS